MILRYCVFALLVSFSQITAAAGLPKGVHEFSGLDPSLPNSDLTQFGNSISRASVIGLGEAMHTSGGFHSVRVRILRFLIEEKGIRALAFETNWSAARKIDQFIQGEVVSEADAIKSLFPQFQSQEILNLLIWIKDFNAAHPQDTVRFFGIDVQQPWDDRAELMSFFRASHPDTVAELTALLDKCATYVSGSWKGPASRNDLQSCRKNLKQISQKIKRGPSAAYIRAAVLSLRAWAEGFFYRPVSDGTSSRTIRDQAMARLLIHFRKEIANRSTTALWAHNGHVTRRGEQMMYPFANQVTGSVLRERFGNRYKAVGLIGYKIEIAPWWSGEGSPQVPSPNSVEGLLHNLSKPYLFIEKDNDLIAEGKVLEINPSAGIPSQQYDALFFLEHSQPMTKPSPK